jgi:hypothetical protein
MSGKGMGILLGILLLAAIRALGDGCILPQLAFARVEIPDQRALIHFVDDTETLVIDTSFRGEGTNFAWIIPVPALPKVEEATTGLFPTLQTIFQPKVIHNESVLLGIPILAGLIICSVVRHQRQGRPVAGLLTLWLLAICLWGMLLPASSSLEVSMLGGERVEVLSRKVVGIYDTATLSSEDGHALVEWLNTNGFATPTNYLPSIRGYAKEGWFFVASKIRGGGPYPGTAKAHPLALTFKTKRPVYPLRLTAIGNSHCRIDLYVFGPDRAEAPGFTVERCARPVYPDLNVQSRVYRYSDELRIRHPLLRRFVAESPVATKLTADLSSAQMQRDAYVDWSPFQEKWLTFYSHRGATVAAANVCVSLVVVALVVWYWTAASQKAWARRCWMACKVVAMAGAVAWYPMYLLLPKTEVSLEPRAVRWMWHLREIPWALQGRWENGATNAPELEWVRRQLREGSPERLALKFATQTNAIFGAPWREEDSPGNYTLRSTSNGVELITYDWEGGATIEPIFPAQLREWRR